MNLSLSSSSKNQAVTILPISPFSLVASSSSSIFPVSIHQNNHDESTTSDYRKALKELATTPQDQQNTHENLLSVFLEANSRNDLTVAEESLRFLAKLTYFQNTTSTSIAATALFCANILKMKREFLSTGNIKTEENNLHTFSVLCANSSNTTSTVGNDDDDFSNEIFSSIDEKQRSILRFANMLFQLEMMKILKEMRSEKDQCASSFKLQLKIEEMESELLKIELESSRNRQEQADDDDDKLLCFDAMKFWFHVLKCCCDCSNSTKLFSKNLMNLLTATRKKDVRDDDDDDDEVKSKNNLFIKSDLQLRAGLMLFDVDAMEHLMKACCPTKVLDKKLQNFGQKKKKKKEEEEKQQRNMPSDNISSSLSSTSSVLERALSLRVLRSQIANSLLLRKQDDRSTSSSNTSSSKQELISRLMNNFIDDDSNQQRRNTEEVSETFAFLGLVKLSKDIFDGKIRVSVKEEKKKDENTIHEESIKLIKNFIEDEEAVSTPEILRAIKSVLATTTKTNSTFHIFLDRITRSLSNLLLSTSPSSSVSSSSEERNVTTSMLDFVLQSLFEERLQIREDFFHMMRLDGSELTFRIYEDERKVEDFKKKIMKMKERTMKDDDEEELDLFLNAVGVF